MYELWAVFLCFVTFYYKRQKLFKFTHHSNLSHFDVQYIQFSICENVLYFCFCGKQQTLGDLEIYTAEPFHDTLNKCCLHC